MASTGTEPGPGEIVDGKYRIVRELGRGGMGLVLAADHLQLGGSVALKLMLKGGDARALERFQREARIVAQLKSQHVCKVFDVGVTADETPYMVMERLEGETLRAQLRRRGALAVEEAVDAVLQASEALAEAHVMGVVHRDLKPENLFVTRGIDGQPFVKVLDFGISKIFSGAGHTLTQTGELLGSPRFMAPEQLQRHRTLDARTDVWALGVVLYELITGHPAFHADTIAELVVFILQDDPEPIAARRPEVPQAVVSAIDRCLEKDPERRFSNVGELAGALAAFASESGHAYVDRIGRILGVDPRSLAPMSAQPSTVVDRAPPSFTAVSQSVSAVAESFPVASIPARRRPSAELTQSAAGASREPPPVDTADAFGATAGTPAAAIASGGDPQAAKRRGRLTAAIAGFAVVVVGVVALARLRGDEGTVEGKETKEAPVREREREVAPRHASPALPFADDLLFASAPQLIEEAVRRNEGHAVFNLVRIYPALLQVEMQHPAKADQVQRHSFERQAFSEGQTLRLDDDDRKQLPGRWFSTGEVRFDRVPSMVVDALARAGDGRGSVDHVSIERRWIAYSEKQKKWIEAFGRVVVEVAVNLSDRRQRVEYWGDGTFRCLPVETRDGDGCPEDP